MVADDPQAQAFSQFYTSYAPGDPDIGNALARIESLQGSDPGFYALAIHSFIESVLRELLCVIDVHVSFNDLVAEFVRRSIQSRTGFIPQVKSMNNLKGAHLAVNETRHIFARGSIADAEVATSHLVDFCAMADITGQVRLHAISQYLAAWDERVPYGRLAADVQRLQTLLDTESGQAQSLASQVVELGRKHKELETAVAKLKIQDSRIAELERINEQRKEKLDKLRSARAETEKSVRSARQRIAELEQAGTYIDTLRRMTVYTRTRGDYERMVLRLTPEQQAVLDQIHLDADFMVKGNAGTGKTLVLLKAMERITRGPGAHGSAVQHSQRIGEDPSVKDASVALVTFTNTLVKYDRYLSEILAASNGNTEISTVDYFLLSRLQEAFPEMRYAVDPSVLSALCALHPVDGFTSGDLATEFEQFIWSNDVTRREYVDACMVRRNMGRAVRRDQRSLVWDALELVVADMERDRVLSFRYMAWKLMRYIEQSDLADQTSRKEAEEMEGRAGNPHQSSALHRYNFMFVDEAQDLSLVVLKILKRLARVSVVLAGDVDQSIYQAGFPLARAGLDIKGRTKTLRTNFRNTMQVHQLAEEIRTWKLAPADGIESQSNDNTCSDSSEALLIESRDALHLDTDHGFCPSQAFREGPPPEIHRGSSARELLAMLQDRVSLYLDHLGYDPENLCILTTSKTFYPSIEQALEVRGLTVSRITDLAFDFTSTKSIRLSTLHSAKGLDFPVVILHLPADPRERTDLDAEANMTMTRNLLYVAMTRPLDHLTVLISDSCTDPVIRHLASMAP